MKKICCETDLVLNEFEIDVAKRQKSSYWSKLELRWWNLVMKHFTSISEWYALIQIQVAKSPLPLLRWTAPWIIKLKSMILTYTLLMNRTNIQISDRRWLFFQTFTNFNIHKGTKRSILHRALWIHARLAHSFGLFQGINAIEYLEIIDKEIKRECFRK